MTTFGVLQILRPALGVHVAADRYHWSHIAQRGENLRITYVTGVENEVRSPQRDEGFRAQQPVRIGDQANLGGLGINVHRRVGENYADCFDWFERRSGRAPGIGKDMCQKFASSETNSTPT